jgi:hypothetical protein
LYDRVQPLWTEAVFHKQIKIAFTWSMPVGTCVAFLVCQLGSGKRHEERGESLTPRQSEAPPPAVHPRATS